MRKTDVLIIGAGPAGIFTALELLRKGSRKHIVIVEKGKPVEKRSCPKAVTKKCVNCRPYCNITTGFSGAGAFSDGKLSLSYEVGGDLPSLIGEEFAQEMIDYTDKIYLEFGADTKVEGVGNEKEVKEIRKRAIQAGLKLVDCPIRHLGTEKAQEIYRRIEEYLLEHGVEILFECHCRDLIVEDEACKGAVLENSRGADWLEKLCGQHDIAHVPGTVDIGVRVEVRNEIMEDVNNILYESKLIGYPLPFKNKVRTFCQNPGGFVSQENYDNDLAVVNGHSYKDSEHEPGDSVLPQFHLSLQPAHRLCPEGGRADEYAGGRKNPRAALRRYLKRQADLAERALPVQCPSFLAGRGGRGHHGGHALPGHDEYHRLHPGGGSCGAGLRGQRDPALFAGAEVLQQPHQDDAGFRDEYSGPLLPGRFQRLDPGPDDGLYHGRTHGPEAGGRGEKGRLSIAAQIKSECSDFPSSGKKHWTNPRYYEKIYSNATSRVKSRPGAADNLI